MEAALLPPWPIFRHAFYILIEVAGAERHRSSTVYGKNSQSKRKTWTLYAYRRVVEESIAVEEEKARNY